MTGGLPYGALGVFDSRLSQGIQFGGTRGNGVCSVQQLLEVVQFTSVFSSNMWQIQLDNVCVQLGESSSYTLSLEINSSGSLYTT